MLTRRPNRRPRTHAAHQRRWYAREIPSCLDLRSKHGGEDDDNAAEQNMTGAAIGADCCPSARRSHPCGADVMPASSMWECEVSVPQSSTGECGHSTSATGSNDATCAQADPWRCAYAGIRGAHERPDRQMKIRLIDQMFKMTLTAESRALYAAGPDFLHDQIKDRPLRLAQNQRRA
jgi:hypothetical protein